jgi:hypothetical protein
VHDVASPPAARLQLLLSILMNSSVSVSAAAGTVSYPAQVTSAKQ